jgi:dinuclear metal center YbgI/SA1388 family protein
VKVKEVLSALEQFAPLPLQESWDNAGLQVGLTEAEVSGALLCLDVTESIIDEAVSRGCNLVVSHHPLLFRGLKTISDLTDVQRTVMKAIQQQVCVVSMHTNMDNALDGVNFRVAAKMGLTQVDFLPSQRRQMAIAGTDEPVVYGSGVVGLLPEPMDARAFIMMLKERFGVASVRANELLQRPVSRVAICGGSGAFLLGDALRAGADAFVTGEMSYHEFFGHEQQLQICVIGHYESEQFTTEVFRDIIESECLGVRTCIAETLTNPIIYL